VHSNHITLIVKQNRK